MGKNRRIYDPKSEAKELGVSLEAYLKVFILGKTSDIILKSFNCSYFNLYRQTITPSLENWTFLWVF